VRHRYRDRGWADVSWPTLWIINQAKMELEEDDFQSALRQIAEAMLERC